MSNNFFHKEQYLRSIGIKCGKGCRVHSTVIISNPKNLILGSNVRIDAFTTILSVKKIHIKSSKINLLVDSLQKPTFKIFNLSGVIVRKKSGFVIFSQK